MQIRLPKDSASNLAYFNPWYALPAPTHLLIPKPKVICFISSLSEQLFSFVCLLNF